MAKKKKEDTLTVVVNEDFAKTRKDAKKTVTHEEVTVMKNGGRVVAKEKIPKDAWEITVTIDGLKDLIRDAKACLISAEDDERFVLSPIDFS